MNPLPSSTHGAADRDDYEFNRRYLLAYFAARLGGLTVREAAKLASRAARRPHSPGLIATAWDGLGLQEGLAEIERRIRASPKYDGKRLRPNDWRRY